jgi:hypothetical protein
MDGKCFMCATPCTLNSLQIRCTGERKCHLQNLQQFQNNFEVEKQGLWNETKNQKTFCIDFDYIHLRFEKFL